MSEELELEEYKECSIRANQVPENQFEFGTGFGWAFEISSSTSNTPLCIVVLKSLSGERTPTNLSNALRLGQNVAHSLIDAGKFEKDYYCYQWEPGGPERPPVTEVDCDKISPGPLHSLLG